MYICHVCGGYPDANDRAILAFNNKIRAEIKGHRKCIDDIETRVHKIKEESKKKIALELLFETIGFDIENHLVD